MSQFRYFRDPRAFADYTAEARECSLCEKERPGYEGPFYGEAEIDFVCEPCLAAGRLAELDLTANEGDTQALRKQLVACNPSQSLLIIEVTVQERTKELETATPHLGSWQDWSWPAHCGDYCRYLKLAGKADLQSAAADGDGRAYLEQHIYPEDDNGDLDDLWESLRPGSPQDRSESYSTEFYLFQCLECGEHVIRWDCD